MRSVDKRLAMQEMNEISRAGLEIARAVSKVYSENSKVRAVIAGGSVSRGYADEFSDLEIGVFWGSQPTDEERKDAISRIGSDIWMFESFEGGKASEHVGLSEMTIGSKCFGGTLMVAPNHLTVDTAEQRVNALIDHLDTTSRNYELASAIRYGIPLHGHVLVEQWKGKVTAFPTHLSIKLVQQNLWLGPWFNWVAYAQRGDHLVLAQHLIWMQQRIVDVLAALNREYVPSPEYKWVHQLIDRFDLKPTDCASRLRATLATADISAAARGLVDLGMEVIDLVETHLPQVNETSLVEGHPEINTSWARQRWAPEPAYTLITNIANDAGV